MAAVIDLHTGTRLPAPQAHGAPRRPQLRVLEGGRSRAVRRRHRVFLVRRLVVASLLLLGVAVAAEVLAPGGPGDAAPVADTTYVVHPGDTLWSVAEQLAPRSDPRVVVDQLAELNGGADLRVGQVLRLPASLG